MSLTNIVYTPVDTGRANVSKEWDNANLKDFYLLTGKVIGLGLLCDGLRLIGFGKN